MEHPRVGVRVTQERQRPLRAAVLAARPEAVKRGERRRFVRKSPAHPIAQRRLREQLGFRAFRPGAKRLRRSHDTGCEATGIQRCREPAQAAMLS
jgi:hypothetical protein